MKLPVPEPFDVLLSVIVGFAISDQQIPLEVIFSPPSSIIVPPDRAVLEEKEVTETVVNVAIVKGAVVNETSLPYAVPALFVAKD